MNKKLMVGFVGALMLVASAVSAQDNAGGMGGGRGGRGGHGGMGGGREIVTVITDATGLTLDQVRTELESGKTLAEVITANGGTVEDVKAQATQVITDNVNQRVTDGKMTQAQADEILAGLSDRLDIALNSTEPMRDGMQMRDGGPRAQILEQAATATGLTTDAIKALIVDGKTLGQVLTDNNVNIDQFVTDALAPVQERLAQDVTDGKISQEVMDARINLFRVELTDRLNNNREPKN